MNTRHPPLNRLLLLTLWGACFAHPAVVFAQQDKAKADQPKEPAQFGLHELRTWTAKRANTKINAKFKNLENGKVVLEDAEKKTVVLDLKVLVDEDRKFLREGLTSIAREYWHESMNIRNRQNKPRAKPTTQVQRQAQQLEKEYWDIAFDHARKAYEVESLEGSSLYARMLLVRDTFGKFNPEQIKADRQQAITILNKGAAKKHVSSLATLARCYRYGVGIPKDLEKANKLLLQARDYADQEEKDQIDRELLFWDQENQIQKKSRKRNP